MVDTPVATVGSSQGVAALSTSGGNQDNTVGAREGRGLVRIDITE